MGATASSPGGAASSAGVEAPGAAGSSAGAAEPSSGRSPIGCASQACQEAVGKQIASYRELGYDASRYFVDYKFDGSYCRLEATTQFTPSDRLSLDAAGVPMIKYGDGFHYNPTTVAQFALTEYGHYLDGDAGAKARFFAGVDVLLSLQDGDGAMRYPFSFKYYLSGQTYQPGWVSGMAQGQMLSVLARAYVLSGDDRYLDAGARAYAFLQVPKADGGPRSTLADLRPDWSDLEFYEEYVSTPDGYTLNGYMFTLLGLYDWWQVAQRAGLKDAAAYGQRFEQGVDTLVAVLPYYDLDGFSAYDLGQYTFDTPSPHVSAYYHMVHIYLLHALHSVTGEPELAQFAQRWEATVS